MSNISIFVNRLKNIGVEVELTSNYPWIYIHSINGKIVTETFRANHGFTVAMAGPVVEGLTNFTDISEIFKLIRKYK